MSARKTLSYIVEATLVATAMGLPMASWAQDIVIGNKFRYADFEQHLKNQGLEIVATMKRFKPRDEFAGIYVARHPNGSAAYLFEVDDSYQPKLARAYMKLEGNVKIFDPMLYEHEFNPFDQKEARIDVPENAKVRYRNEQAIEGECKERKRTRQFPDFCGPHNEVMQFFAGRYMRPLIQGDTVIEFPNAQNPERIRVTLLLRSGMTTMATEPGTPDGVLLLTAGSGTSTFFPNFSPHSGYLTKEGIRQVRSQ